MTFNFSAQITIDFKNKTSDEVKELYTPFIDLVCEHIDPKFNPRLYLKIKTLSGKFTIIKGEKRNTESTSKESFFISPYLTDYEVIINLINALKKVYLLHDERFGKMKVSLTSKLFKDGIRFDSLGNLEPSITGLSFDRVDSKLQSAIDALNEDIKGLDKSEDKE